MLIMMMIMMLITMSRTVLRAYYPSSPDDPMIPKLVCRFFNISYQLAVIPSHPRSSLVLPSYPLVCRAISDSNKCLPRFNSLSPQLLNKFHVNTPHSSFTGVWLFNLHVPFHYNTIHDDAQVMVMQCNTLHSMLAAPQSPTIYLGQAPRSTCSALTAHTGARFQNHIAYCLAMPALL